MYRDASSHSLIPIDSEHSIKTDDELDCEKGEGINVVEYELEYNGEGRELGHWREEFKAVWNMECHADQPEKSQR